jgi:hypothetical protein
MRNPTLSILSLAVATALAGNLAAQNDDCTGAINVAQGANGPFTNVGATTSAPAWPCALGGNDVWYSYVAPGTGSLTADLCGSGFDTALEVFDGTGGCAGLVSLMCNDDSCGLQSSVTVNVTVGTTYYIRVGGFNSSTGSFTLNINGPAPSGTVATATSYGAGCGRRAASFYEFFATAASHDLANTGISMLNTGTGYLVMPGITSYVAPTGAATALTLTDDSETQVALSSPFVYAGGITSSLNVCSNGHVAVATGNGTAYTPVVGTMLSAPQTGWWCWHDYNPTLAGSGQVKFEEVGGTAYITWDGVFDFGTTGPGSTFQLQFELATGNVHYAFGAISGLGNAHLVGFSPGGASIDPGSIDISTVLPSTFTLNGADVSPIALSAAQRPIIGTTIGLTTSNVGATAPFGAITLGFSDPAFDLTPLGMAGCTQHTDTLVTLLFLPLGAPSYALPFNVPNVLGLTILAQSFVYDPASNLTALGATASNGLSLFLGNQ